MGAVERSLSSLKDSPYAALVVMNQEDYALLKAYLMVEGAISQVHKDFGTVPLNMVPMVPVT